MQAGCGALPSPVILGLPIIFEMPGSASVSSLKGFCKVHLALWGGEQQGEQRSNQSRRAETPKFDSFFFFSGQHATSVMLVPPVPQPTMLGGPCGAMVNSNP